MKTTLLAGIAIVATLPGVGCATKKYVAKTVDPVQTRVAGAETKNAEQDKQIAGQASQLDELDRGLSRTNEKLGSTDQAATAAGNAARAADLKADNAQKSADSAAQAAGQAGTMAKTLTDNLGHSVDGMNRFKQAKSETVLFGISQWTLQDEATSHLAAFCQSTTGVNRYIVEVQGFTDKTGTSEVNELLSQRRAQEVARYLANECKIPLRQISLLGSGYAQPVADDKTRDGRKQNRRVEVRLFVPEVETIAQATTR